MINLKLLHCRYIEYSMNMIKMLQYYKVIPVLVFDGSRLPTKSATESSRQEKRLLNKQMGNRALMSENKNSANEYFKKAVDITPQMAYTLIEELRKNNIEFIVAPYEADAQMAYLSITGYVACVITEDSDLIPYGASPILFKMNSYGEGDEYRKEYLANNRDLNFSQFTDDMLIRMCILAGCDYLSSLKGIGIKKAYNIVKECRTIPRIMDYLRRNMRQNIFSNYEDGFKRAELTFKYQRVFDPLTRTLIHLHPVPNTICENLDFCGPIIEPTILNGICTGQLDPTTHKPFAQAIRSKWHSDGKLSSSNSIFPSNKFICSRTNSISSYFNHSYSIVKQPFNPPRKLESHEIQVGETPTKIKTVVKSQYFSKPSVHQSSQQAQSSSNEESDSLQTLNIWQPSDSPATSKPKKKDNGNLTDTMSLSSSNYLSQDSIKSVSLSYSVDNEDSQEDGESISAFSYSTDRESKLSPFTSPLINNSLPRIGMSTREGKSPSRRSSILEGLYRKYFYQSSSSLDSSSQSSSVVCIEDEEEELEDDKFSSQTSFCYDEMDEPKRKKSKT